MRLDRDGDRLIRLLGALIWLLLLLVFSVVLCALIGWVMGDAGRGCQIGMLLNGLFWLVLLRAASGGRK